MKTNQNFVKTVWVVIVVVVCCYFSNKVSASSYTAIQSGNWEDPTTWGQLTAYPTTGDDAAIGTNLTVTVNGTADAAATIELGDAVGTGTLTFNGTSSLTVSGAITVGSSTEAGILTMTSNATLSCGSLVSGSGGASYNLNAGTVEFTGSFSVPSGATTFNNLTINSSGTVYAASNTTINGTLTLLQDYYGAANNVTLGSGATIIMGGGILAALSSLQGSNPYDLVYTTLDQNTGPETQNSGLRNVTINASGKTITLENPTTMTGILALTAGTLNANNLSLTIGGNITGTGSNFTAGTGSGTVILNGSVANQSIPAITFDNLTLNNTASSNPGATLTGSCTVNSTLTLTAGLLALGSNNLTLAGGSGISGGSSTSFIQVTGSGVCVAQAISATTTIPIGDEFAPITISNGGGADYSLGVVNSVTGDGGSPILSSHVVAITWNVQVSSTVTNAVLTFQWPQSSEQTSFDRTNSYVAMRTSPTGAWAPLASPSPANGSSPNYNQSATVPSMSNGTTYYFAVGDDASPLPVSLITFSAQYQDGHVNLNWATASEQNNAYFDVERSTDAANWANIGQVQGHGTSDVVNNYSDVDNLAGIIPSGILYYRLKQVDFNGNYTYSMIRSVDINNPVPVVSAYPNPATSVLCVNWTSNSEDNTILRLMNESGENIYEQTVSGKGIIQKQIDMSMLPPGIYFVQLIGSSKVGVVNQSIIKQ